MKQGVVPCPRDDDISMLSARGHILIKSWLDLLCVLLNYACHISPSDGNITLNAASHSRHLNLVGDPTTPTTMIWALMQFTDTQADEQIGPLRRQVHTVCGEVAKRLRFELVLYTVWLSARRHLCQHRSSC